MDDLTRAPGLPLWSDHTRFLRRHRGLLAALMAFGVVAGLCWALAQESTFSATASVTLVPVPVYVMPTVEELVPPEVSIDTDAQLLQSPAVIGAVAQALGTDDARARERLSVTASPNTRVLHVSVSDGDPADAAAAANAAVDALVDVRRRTLGALSAEQLRQLRFLVSGQDLVLAREQSRRVVIHARDEVFTHVLELHDRLDELEAARRDPAEVIQGARTPVAADYANTEVSMTSGAMLGLLVGCLLGTARDRSPHTPTHDEEHHHVA